ncbi:hypothetical protein V6N11_065465 [Hibiscus sabdariffa]|uniref:Uncharacterized protein n=1 Tax=Hibiscus sabdariffa TaxID=183260 RepID=A0ABR2PHS4_9ROSI
MHPLCVTRDPDSYGAVTIEDEEETSLVTLELLPDKSTGSSTSVFERNDAGEADRIGKLPFPLRCVVVTCTAAPSTMPATFVFVIWFYNFYV